jgi:hypothetical protein
VLFGVTNNLARKMIVAVLYAMVQERVKRLTAREA